MTRIPPVPIPPAQNQRLGVFSESARRRKRVSQHSRRRPRRNVETFLGEIFVILLKGIQREEYDEEANERRFLRRGCGTRERQLEQQQKHEQQRNAYHHG